MDIKFYLFKKNSSEFFLKILILNLKDRISLIIYDIL